MHASLSINKTPSSVQSKFRHNHTRSFYKEAQPTQKSPNISIKYFKSKIRKCKIIKMPPVILKPIGKPPPYTTAQSWSVFEGFSKVRLCNKFSSFKREIASLTKMMVLYTWIQLWNNLKLNPEITEVIVPK